MVRHPTTLINIILSVHSHLGEKVQCRVWAGALESTNLLWRLHGLTLGWICWKDSLVSWIFSTCEQSYSRLNDGLHVAWKWPDNLSQAGGWHQLPVSVHCWYCSSVALCENTWMLKIHHRAKTFIYRGFHKLWWSSSSINHFNYLYLASLFCRNYVFSQTLCRFFFFWNYQKPQ